MSDNRERKVPSPKERVIEKLHMAIIGLKSCFGELEDGANLATQMEQRILAEDLNQFTAEIEQILGGTAHRKGLVQIRQDIKASNKAEESK